MLTSGFLAWAPGRIELPLTELGTASLWEKSRCSSCGFANFEMPLDSHVERLNGQFNICVNFTGEFQIADIDLGAICIEIFKL